MATAERFVVGPGEKALVLGCKESDFTAWMRQHPAIKERIDFLSEDDVGRKDSLSSGYKGVLFCRHVNHADNGRIQNLARKAGINFIRFFPRSVDLKAFLQLSVLVSSAVVPVTDNGHSTVAESAPAQQIIETPVVETVKNQATVVEIRKAKRGEVKEFVFDNANFEAKHSKKEVQRLLELATEKGLKTTYMSLEVAFYRIKKINKPTDPTVVSETDSPKVSAKKPKAERNVLYKYLDFLTESQNNSLVAAQAIKELLTRVETFEVELAAKQTMWDNERAQLIKSNSELKKENVGLKTEIEKLASVFRKFQK